MAEGEKPKFWRRFFRREILPFIRLNPVSKAAALPEIQAAARFWRLKLETGFVQKANPLDTRVILKEPLSQAELDAFERALHAEFATAKAYTDDSPLWQSFGLEIWMHLYNASCDAGIKDKIDTFGFMTRMRIMPNSVDHEVGEITDYRKGNWENAWRPAVAA